MGTGELIAAIALAVIGIYLFLGGILKWGWMFGGSGRKARGMNFTINVLLGAAMIVIAGLFFAGILKF
ncbi:MAG: hypothetical protein IKH67_00670 [Lachnospiraceae bacterium]|nr:hypothetical protein [Lachnospiraceae bacterium]MBR3003566.1 hypothetical protein [Lachnospiraceae bacterium]MBR6348963.1 hypothetical protein [Lachnospiraceae bacterium]